MKKFSHIAQKHIHKASQHITKHHRKYLVGLMGYLTAHLFFVKIFVFKVAIIKVVVIILAIAGIYSRHSSFASIQPICVNNIGFIPLSKCEVNFTNIKDAIIYIEDKIKLSDSTIYDSTDYQTLNQTLHNYCPENQDKETDQIIKRTIDELLTSLPQDKGKKIAGLFTMFTAYKKHIIQANEDTDTNDFCQEKYIDYMVINEIKKDFFALLNAAKLNTTQNSVYDSIDKKDDTILGPLLDEQIVAKKLEDDNGQKITATNDLLYNQYFKDGSYSKKISEKIVNLGTMILNMSMQKLVNDKVFNSSDIKALDKKITMKYIPDCRKVQGFTTVAETMDRTKRIRAEIQNITLNINICFNYQYIQGLSTYIEQIMVHELGHYIFYIKDNQSQSFEKICRKNGKISCPKDEFVSKYSQTGPEEDYAESFLHRYLGDIASKKIYTGKYYSGNYFSGGYILQTKQFLNSKLNYFATLFK
ncbi:MAG: hypothetical protein WC010_04425 [Candidatus Absconditabacterales bacterium]